MMSALVTLTSMHRSTLRSSKYVVKIEYMSLITDDAAGQERGKVRSRRRIRSGSR